MKLEYTLNHFSVMVERQGDYELAVTGVDGDYRYKLTDLTTGKVTTSKRYKRAHYAERYGRQALAAKTA